MKRVTTCGFRDNNLENLHEEINDFLLDFEEQKSKFIDIKFSTCVDEDSIYYSALLIYEEDQEEEIEE